MCPHVYSRGDVRKVEVARLRLPDLVRFAIDEVEDEERIVVPRVIVRRPRSELLVGRHVRTRNVVREEECVGRDVSQLDHVAVTHDASAAGRRKRFRGDDLPVVVGVIVGVGGDLLTLATDAPVSVPQRVLVRVRVKVRFSFLVLDDDGVIVANFLRSKSTHANP